MIAIKEMNMPKDCCNYWLTYIQSLQRGTSKTYCTMELTKRMNNRKECPMRHTNGNCLAIGGFCTAVQDEICFALRKTYEDGKLDGMREALTPRVMPLTNVMEWMGEIDELRDPVYWENRREQYESQWLLEAKNPLYMIEAIKKGVARVWTWKPTEEQSKAVKWNA